MYGGVVCLMQTEYVMLLLYITKTSSKPAGANNGDRQNELVFIGQNMDIGKITAKLNACLLQDNELEFYDHNRFADPFPRNI